MANTSNNHNSNNQPRRKRNKKPVKRYSEEYNNRPNPYTGYTADGNYHPEAKKRTAKETPSPRAKAAEEERIAAMNAAMAEAAWGPAPSKSQQPQQPQQVQQPSRQVGFVPPTVNVPAPKWAVSNNLTRQQLAAQEQIQNEPVQNAAPTSVGEGDSSDTSNRKESSSPQRSGSSHRKKNHRSKDEAARERAAKTEAKRAAVEKIAMGVAAHSVSEQMIEDISSISDAIESMPKPQKAPTEKSVNWEEFYDAAFPPKAQENSKFASKKTKAPKKRVDFNEDASADSPMIVKPVMLGDDDLLPYDKITLENEREAAGNEKAPEKKAEKKAEKQEKPVADTKAAQLAAAFKVEEEEKSAKSVTYDLPEMQERPADTPVLDSVEDTLNDISDVVNTVSIEEILAEVERQKLESVRKAETIRKSAEITMDSGFSFDSAPDSSWNEVIPARNSEEEEEEEEKVEEPDDSDSLLSRRLMLSYLEAEQQADDEAAMEAARDAELENIETVDLNQFLSSPEHPSEEESAGNASVPAMEETTDESVEFVPEIIIDSAELDKRASEEAANEKPDQEETVETVSDRKAPEIPATPAAKEEPEENQAETENATVQIFVEDKSEEPTVEVIVADLEDEIFAEERLTSPEGKAEETPDEEAGIDVEDKIEKLAEAAEIAEVFRQESEDISPEEPKKADSEAFSVSIDDISVTPEVKTDEEEVIKEYQPREKTRQPDENLFESVLIVDDNPSIIDKKASEAQDNTLFLHLRESSENPTAVFKLPEGPIVFPTDIDDAEFQEQWLDEDEDGDDMASRNKRTRRRISAFIGSIALLFAALILFSAVKTVVSGFNNIGSTSEKKTEYTTFISPVVVNDPLPFESVDKADNNMLLQSSMLLALQELDATEGYEHVSDATDKIILPAENVEKSAKELFGKDVKLNMNVLSENDGSALYYFDSIDKTFHITRSGITGPTAMITKIAQKSDYISLVVGYIKQEEMTATSSESTEAECYKFMEYVLALNSDGSYYINSIRNYVDD